LVGLAQQTAMPSEAPGSKAQQKALPITGAESPQQEHSPNLKPVFSSTSVRQTYEKAPQSNSSVVYRNSIRHSAGLPFGVANRQAPLQYR
jgi:hypothetical protein